MTNQQFTDPFVAVVIDPNRTISAGRVDIGAFRTYPAGYTPPDASTSEYQSIPLNKIEDFGVHANSYYPLKVEHFKSSLDEKLLGMLWEKYWVGTLSQSPLVVNREYITGQTSDLASKLAQAKGSTSSTSTTLQPLPRASGGAEQAKQETGPSSEEKIGKAVAEIRKREDETPLAKITRDGNKLSNEVHHGLMTQVYVRDDSNGPDDWRLTSDLSFSLPRLQPQGRAFQSIQCWRPTTKSKLKGPVAFTYESRLTPL